MPREEALGEGKELLAKGRIKEAGERFREALAADAGSSDARLWLARMALLLGQRKEADGYLKAILSKSPDNAEAHALKGFCLMTEKDYPNAVILLEKARTFRPALEMIYQNLAKSYRKIGNWKAAETIASEGIKRFPKNPLLRFELGFTLAKTKRLKEGIKEMLEAISIDPLFLKAYLVLGRLYEAAHRPDLVIGLYRKALTHTPNAWIFREEICRLYMAKEDSVRAYREAAELAVRRNGVIDFLRLGNLAMKLGKSKKAERAFMECTQRDNECWPAYLNLGGIYFAAGEFETAKSAFARAMQAAPNYSEPAYNMALVCKALKDTASAKQYASIAMNLSRKGDAVYEQALRMLEAS